MKTFIERLTCRVFGHCVYLYDIPDNTMKEIINSRKLDKYFIVCSRCNSIERAETFDFIKK